MNESPRQLGAYVIEREVGRGGMGVVYLARDPRLDRAVAIKVLPAELGHDPERLARFQREARLLASVNHPNIGGIYGIEEDGGTRFLVLEYIDGPTLAERLQRGGLPVDEAMDVCRQIADALETAHENGVIHRDLKPANVKLTPEGSVKVLDFGLAKGETRSDSDSDLSHSPTLTSVHATEAGVILGTAAYMSPEQARGRAVDRRTDIFSFGCVLYECLTGRQVFGGETVTDTMAKILEREPDWSALPGATPEKIRRLLRRCLEKDARKRQRDIGDARLAFEEVEQARTSSVRAAAAVAGPADTGSRRSALLAWGIALIAVVVAIGALVLPDRSASVGATSPVRFTIEPPAGVTMAPWTPGIHISPNGDYVLWTDMGDATGAGGTWMRSLESLELHRLPGLPAVYFSFLSPDGEWLGFQHEGRIRRVRIDGGDPESICNANSSRGASWGKDSIVFAEEQGPLYRVAATGGTPEPITSLNQKRGETAHRFPQFLPDGETFLYVTLPGRSGRVDVFAGDIHGREPVEIMTAVSAPVYAEPGFLLFQIGNRVMAQRFDAGSLSLRGEPVEIARAPRRPDATGAPALSASRNGHLAFLTPEDPNTEVVWLDRKGEVVETIDLEPAWYTAPVVSPDGRYVAVTKVVSPEESDIWVVELDRAVVTRVTFGPGQAQDAVWSPDGKYIAYSTDADGVWNIYRKPFPGGGDPEPVAVGDATFKNPLDWSPDGKYLLYEQIGTGTNMDLWIAPMDGTGEPRPYLAEVYQEDSARFSPDGRWVAYESAETGDVVTFVNSFPEPGRKHRVSVGIGRNPMWGSGGSELLFAGGDGLTVFRVPIQTSPAFSAGTPEPLFRRGSGLLSPSPDGSRFLQARRGSNQAKASVTVVLNWASALPER